MQRIVPIYDRLLYSRGLGNVLCSELFISDEEMRDWANAFTIETAEEAWLACQSGLWMEHVFVAVGTIGVKEIDDKIDALIRYAQKRRSELKSTLSKEVLSGLPDIEMRMHKRNVDEFHVEYAKMIRKHVPFHAVRRRVCQFIEESHRREAEMMWRKPVREWFGTKKHQHDLWKVMDKDGDIVMSALVVSMEPEYIPACECCLSSPALLFTEFDSSWFALELDGSHKVSPINSSGKFYGWHWTKEGK